MSVHRRHQVPGALVGHAEPAARRGDRTGVADRLQQVGLAGAEGQAIGQQQADAEVGGHPGREPRMRRLIYLPQPISFATDNARGRPCIAA
jgi:hypothetical protein